ncbi:protein SUPPRESSOR OF GENE SILENCING 3 homolog [Helianthus annuus]|uniref:protein SUPPRESSOR OF GENE SILENCING 3 homolog n=1 Tax=Helianthus annuus TaxID=4232 RepID=UPI001652FAFE|nr:protein SUPPRESSOR OF GENE SILENCING 3 homolog [Helianthus annuus]
MATKQDMDLFNKHSQGNTKLKFDMVSYQEKAVSQLRQMSEDNQQLHWSLLKKHKQGKKHLKRMKRLADSSANPPNMLPPPVASEIVVGEMKNKKQRLLQNGATAETLLSCDVCNVICNNQEGFQQHIASKKHAAKVTSIIFYLDYCLYIIYFFLLKVFHYN